ncbi:MAG: 50S ribosomal protein L25 [Anaerolineaceae bacterium]|nr:50S ribosomal protein L25 [Anaerolineaceae bacterium]
MDKIVLKATKRSVTGKKVGALRRQGLLPAVMYGSNIDSIPITLDRRETSRILATLMPSSLVMIDLGDKEYPTLVRDKQRDYLKGEFLHVDFLVVSLTETVRTNVRIVLEGTSPAVRDLNGVLMRGLDELEIECLPNDLPESIVIDLSVLKKIGDSILVKDVKLPGTVEILDDPDGVLISITYTEAEEEVEEEIEEISMDEPEVIEKGKREGELEDE